MPQLHFLFLFCTLKITWSASCRPGNIPKLILPYSLTKTGDSFINVPLSFTWETYRDIERQVSGGGGFPRVLVDAPALGEYALSKAFPPWGRLLLLEAASLAAWQLYHRVVLGRKVLWPTSCWWIGRVNYNFWNSTLVECLLIYDKSSRFYFYLHLVDWSCLLLAIKLFLILWKNTVLLLNNMSCMFSPRWW